MAELPERLRAAADAHRPDRERMLARVERGMRPAGRGTRQGRWERPPAPWTRVVAVTAAVAGAVGLGGLAVGAVDGTGGGTDEPGQTVVVTSDAATTHQQPPPAVSGIPGAATALPKPGTTGPGRTVAGQPRSHGTPGGQDGKPAHTTAGSVTPSAGAGGAPPSVTRGEGSGTGMTAAGSVGGGSNNYWTQDEVTVTVGRPLTSLTVELRVVADDGVKSSGQWSTVNAADITSSSGTGNGYLVFRWVLSPGRTLQPGTYTFAGQFGHAAGERATGGDGYQVAGDGPGGAVTAAGGF